MNEKSDEFDPRHHGLDNGIICIASVTFEYDHCQTVN